MRKRRSKDIERRPDAIHKINLLSGGAFIMACGREEAPASTYDWEHVTCRKCLRRKPAHHLRAPLPAEPAVTLIPKEIWKDLTACADYHRKAGSLPAVRFKGLDKARRAARTREQRKIVELLLKLESAEVSMHHRFTAAIVAVLAALAPGED